MPLAQLCLTQLRYDFEFQRLEINRRFLSVRLLMIIYEFEIKKVDLNLSEVHEICDAGMKLQQIDSAWMVVMSH